MWAHKGPVLVSFDSLHEEVGDPEGVEKVAGAVFLSAVVFAKLQEFINVCMPWLKVDSKCAFALTAPLVHIPSRVIVDLEHGHQAILVPICPRYVRILRPNAVHSKADTTRVL